MDPISRLNRMMEVLRQQLSESAKKISNARSSSGSSLQSRSPAARASAEELRLRLRERIRTLASGQEKRARRMFVESVLAWEFGEQVLLDPHFHRVIDHVEEAFESNPQLNAQLQEMLDALGRP